ncbi:MAG: serine/threonine-protein kinase, partial [Proteobacteria bacterium]|nr:serine/threonine-protein kinase [Pseudomonadota bacterium]
EFAGSVLYAAPEQFTIGGDELDGRADLYALGLVLYELSTGRHPFADDDLATVMHSQLSKEPTRPGELNPQLSPFFEELILCLLAKDREHRPDTAQALQAVASEQLRTGTRPGSAPAR